MTLSTVAVATDPPYPVVVGPGALGALADVLTDEGAALVADRAVAALHVARLGPAAELPRLELAGGEEAKTLARLGEVLEFLARAGLSRRSTVVTLGGGTIGDLGGLAASLFKRGCAVVHAPTTLLAQVDASVGGKTAVNLAAGKNLAGTFHQPRAVFADSDVLATLPDEEFASGLGEVVKTALIGGEASFAALEASADELAAREPRAVSAAVRRCVETKARVVASDPTERGPRRALNLGHTFAHGIEHAAGFGAIPHGVAVAVGLVLAARAAEREGRLADGALPRRIAALLGRLGLPTGLAELRVRHAVALDPAALVAGLAHDKKGSVGAPEFVLPRRAGEIDLGVRLDPRRVEELFGA